MDSHLNSGAAAGVAALNDHTEVLTTVKADTAAAVLGVREDVLALGDLGERVSGVRGRGRGRSGRRSRRSRLRGRLSVLVYDVPDLVVVPGRALIGLDTVVALIKTLVTAGDSDTVVVGEIPAVLVSSDRAELMNSRLLEQTGVRSPDFEFSIVVRVLAGVERKRAHQDRP